MEHLQENTQIGQIHLKYLEYKSENRIEDQPLNVQWITMSWSPISKVTMNGTRSTDILSPTINFFYHQLTRNHPQKT